MMAVITIFVILIFFLLLGLAVGAFLAWQKVAVFLTWNTRYEAADYEQAIQKPKSTKPAGVPIKTEQRGRSVVQSPDLVELDQIPLETAISAIEEAGR